MMSSIMSMPEGSYMEKDLGKIREHLGTANMREILGHD
jgi:hypothetical protein